jgi:hypothetical protein
VGGRCNEILIEGRENNWLDRVKEVGQLGMKKNEMHKTRKHEESKRCDDRERQSMETKMSEEGYSFYTILSHFIPSCRQAIINKNCVSSRGH